MGVGVGDLTTLSHEVLEVLPGSPGGQILNHQSVASFAARGVAPPPGGRTTTPGAQSGIPSVLQPNPPVPELPATIQILDSILGIFAVFEINEGEVALEHNIIDPAVALEELLDVTAVSRDE